MFINIFYISTLINNFYNISYLFCCGYNINIKFLKKTTFSINGKIIGYIDKTQEKYVIQFLY